MLFPLPPLLLDIIHHFAFIIFSERVEIYPVGAHLAVCQTLLIDWFLYSFQLNFFAYNFSQGDVSAYFAEKVAPGNRQKR